MTARDVFVQAREAALRIRSVEARLQEMHDRIGVQGRGGSSISIGSVLDPMRKVDDLLDWESTEYASVLESSQDAIDEARVVLRGMAAMGYKDAADALRLRYLRALSAEAVASRVGHSADVVEMMCETALKWCDEVGLAKIKEAGNDAAR